ncbi:MAG: response regulator [Ignavibacteriaceae bacterium]|nr:response regulator [Ignavibacteriaceae bacterium]
MMTKSVLIIEDDQLLHKFYKYVFERAGICPIITEDADDVIHQLKNEKIHLIIMDINLKNTYLDGQKIDGIRLSRYIKLNAEFSKIPILLVTAYSLSSRENSILDESMAEGIIVKPIVDYNQFLNTINKLMIN